jgi:hypothetical protein
MQQVDRLVWAASSTYRVGPFLLGVRTDTSGLDGVLRAALGAHLVDGVQAPPNYSLQANASSREGRLTTLGLLFWSSSLVLRTRSTRRLVEGLFGHLGSYVAGSRGGLLQVEAFAAVRDGRAVLAPLSLRNGHALLHARLQRAGALILDSPLAAVDPARGELVVEDPLLTIDRAALAGLDEAGAGDAGLVTPGRYRIAGWVLPRLAQDHGSISRAVAVLRTFSLVNNRLGLAGQSTLAGLAAVFGVVDAVLVDVSGTGVAASLLDVLAA